MLKMKLMAVFAFAAILAACGGDKEVYQQAPDKQTDQSTPGSQPGAGQVPEDFIESEVIVPRMGTGIGATFESGKINVSVPELSAGGTTQVSANIVNAAKNFEKITSAVYVAEITSNCAEAERAKFSRKEVTTSSEINVTYEAKGCVGADTITIKLFDADKKLVHAAVGTVTVAQAEVGALAYVTTQDPALSINTIANKVLPTITNVTFKVIDQSGFPIEGKKVDFSLLNNNGGVTLARTNGFTDADGLVVAVVSSGSTHTSVMVKASTTSLDGTKVLQTSSLPISITTGIPREDRFSLSLSKFNPAGFNFDGEEVDVNVVAGDAFGNPVADGTVVNFMAESGIVGSYCQTKAGRCTVTWTSGGDRPSATSPHPQLKTVNERIGMTSLLAYSLGEAGFTDSNGNNTFDANEPFVSFAEPFLDTNWNSLLDVNGTLPVENFVDTDSNGVHSPAPLTYRGALCSAAAKASGHCANLMHVRAETRFIQSLKDSVRMRLYKCNPISFACVEQPAIEINMPTRRDEFHVVLQDDNGNIPAAGTVFSASGEGYDVSGDSGVVPNSIGLLSTLYTGLPEYGALYHVIYKPDPNAMVIDHIVLKAISGSKTVSYGVMEP